MSEYLCSHLTVHTTSVLSDPLLISNLPPRLHAFGPRSSLSLSLSLSHSHGPNRHSIFSINLVTLLKNVSDSFSYFLAIPMSFSQIFLLETITFFVCVSACTRQRTPAHKRARGLVCVRMNCCSFNDYYSEVLLSHNDTREVTCILPDNINTHTRGLKGG